MSMTTSTSVFLNSAFTGSVQTFTAPVSGIYKFELWGSPGASTDKALTDDIGRGGEGGYISTYIKIDKNTLVNNNLYIYVGGNGKIMGEFPDTDEETNDGEEVGDDYEGTEHVDIAISGWNGGGATLTCQAGHHSVSGGGATHVSTTQNYIKSDEFIRLERTTYNTDGTVKKQGDYNYDEVWGYGAGGKNAVENKGVAQITSLQAAQKKADGRRVLRVDHGNIGIGGDKNHRWYIIINEWNPNGTIALAGGGGGGLRGGGGSHATTFKNEAGRTYSYAGGEVAGKLNAVGHPENGGPTKAQLLEIPAAENETNTGYTHGKGMYGIGGSGGGAGWHGGYSCMKAAKLWTGNAYESGNPKQGNGNVCGTSGGGGTSYVNKNLIVKDATGTPVHLINWGGNSTDIPNKPNTISDYWNYNPEAGTRGGYCRITLQK